MMYNDLKRGNFMANPNLAIRFTDEVYATRQEVVKTLGTSLIEPIWQKVLEYRSGYSSFVGMSDVNKEAFQVVLCTNVVSKSGFIGKRFDKLLEESDMLSEGSIEKNTYRVEMFKTILRNVARLKGIIINDIALENIIYGRNTNLLYQPLVNYFNALLAYDTKASSLIDEGLLASYLEILSGGGELLSFYRNSEISLQGQKVLINREYVGAPVDQIERMMSELLDFIRKPNYDLSIKMAVTYYMVNYVKPFESFNEEIAFLLMRHLMAANGYAKVAGVLPLEIILNDPSSALLNANKESQRTRDLTYYVNEVSKKFEEAISYSLDRMVLVSRDSLAKAYFTDDTQEKEEVSPTIPTFHQEEKQQVVSPKEEVKKVEPEVVTPKVEVANNEPKVNVASYQDLDEKALRKATEELLESDPNLRPAQAHFYVRHCTLGRYYTIQQFKKAEGVVYETARTSMDTLAKRGYYRREQVKNKFVYTPISKK